MEMKEKNETDAKNVNESDGNHSKNNGKALLDLRQITGIPYSKEGDSDGFLRYRIVGKTAVDGTICQVTGYVTEIKGSSGA